MAAKAALAHAKNASHALAGLESLMKQRLLGGTDSERAD